MARYIALLRGVNLGPRNRIGMPALRQELEAAGFEDVKTYLQSGNIVLGSKSSVKRVASDVERLIADHFGLDIKVVVRTRAELATVVRRNPFGKVAKDPKRYQVSFLDAAPKPKVVKSLAEAAVAPEQFTHIGRELYAWHPDGVGRSKLATLLGGKGVGITATARNWTTVTRLLAMADD